MANRRMFSKNIVRTDKFLDMPQSSRLLYYDLGVDADDDGFVSPKMIMRLTGASDDDLKMLIAKGFVYQFEDGVIVILDWKINNEIRQDRYSQTQYLENKNKLLLNAGRYSMVLPTVLPVVGHSIGKVRVGKDIKKEDKEKTIKKNEITNELVNLSRIYFETFNRNFKNYNALTSNYLFWRELYSAEQIQEAMRKAQFSEYWKEHITPVILLRQKDTKGNGVDRIGEFLALEEVKSIFLKAEDF